MIKKFLLVMESKTEELTMMMKSKCETWTLTIHLRGAVQKTQLIAPPIQELTENQELTEKHLLLKEQMNIRPLMTKESKRDEAWDEIRRKFPKVNTSKFTTTLDDIGRVFVKLIREKGKSYPLFNKDGEVNDKLPKTIIKDLGTPAEDIIRTKEEEISRRENKIKELQASRETASENQREQIDANIEEQQNEISRLEAKNEIIEERMSLRDRVKAIFKKYGFTVFAVVSAVGLVIGVIVSNLQKGLTSLGKGVGGALKNIGKKIGEILPGMIGAIASFVFKTAGQAVGFIAKHAWLLILAAVTIMIEKLKK